MIADLWGYGITDTHKVYDADGLALYFKALVISIPMMQQETEHP